MTEKMSDAEINALAQEIFENVRSLDSPRDAASVLTMAQYKLLVATFAPHEQAAAISSIDADCELLKKFIIERVM